MRRFVAFVFVLSLLLSIFATHSYAAVFDFSADENLPDTGFARCIYLYHIESSTVMFEKNADMSIPPASNTKLMTAILAIEELGTNLGVSITVTAEMLENVSGNNIALREGEVVTVRDMLYSLIIGGSNDAAYVLAHKISGDTDTFVERMNERAVELGCTDTVFKNPTGMDEPGAMTTVRDVAKIAMYAYSLGTFMDIAANEKYEMPATNLTRMRRIWTKNYFILYTTDDTYYRSDILGLNAGSTSGAGACVTAIADSGSSKYLCVVMGASVDSDHVYSYITAGNLIDWGDSAFEYKTVLSAADMITELAVSMSDKNDHVILLPEYEVVLYLPISFDAADVRREWTLTQQSLTAPVEAGEEVGVISLYIGDEFIESVHLVTKNNVDRSQSAMISAQVNAIIGSRPFVAAVVIAIVLLVGYVLLVAYLRGEAQKKRRNKKL